MEEERRDDFVEKKDDLVSENSMDSSDGFKPVSPEPKPEPTSFNDSPMRIDNSPDAQNPWKVAALIFGVAAIVLLVISMRGGFAGMTGNGTGNVIAEDDAGDKILDYLNDRTGGGVELVEVNGMGGNLYEALVEYQGQEIPVYVTKDGEYFVQGAVPMDLDLEGLSDAQEQEAPEVPKSDKPVVELFIMTHCPYGTQAEKGFLPVLELLGDKIEGSIRFVHYFMHEPEETETPIQVCIREEQGDRFNDYLSCFLEDGDSDRCLEETGIDTAKLDSCVETKSEEYYDVDSVLSEDYGVRGSPTLVINGVQASSGRSPSAYLEAVCSAFNDAPEECEEELSTQTYSPGFGYEASENGGSAGQC